MRAFVNVNDEVITLSTQEIATLLGVVHLTVIRWIRAGKLAGRLPMGNRRYGYRVKVDDLLAMLDREGDPAVASRLHKTLRSKAQVDELRLRAAAEKQVRTAQRIQRRLEKLPPPPRLFAEALSG